MTTARLRPPPVDKATRVTVGAYLLDVMNFDEQAKTFEADVIVTWRWFDPRLAEAAATRHRLVPLADIWSPQLIAVNRRSAQILFPAVAEVDSVGNVSATQRFVGSATVPVRLREFPFDHQEFFFEVVSRGYSPTEVELVMDPDKIGQEPDLSLSGWRMGHVAVAPVTKRLISNNGGPITELAGFRVAIEGARDWQYYVLREILPLAFIVLMSSSLFWLPAKEHGMKIGISTAAIFSLMAYYVQLGRSLPRLDYLTRMDRFVIGSTCLVFIGFAQVIAGMYLVKRERVTEVERMERWARGIYPALFLFVVWGSFVLGLAAPA